jgi:hypothetical protein
VANFSKTGGKFQSDVDLDQLARNPYNAGMQQSAGRYQEAIAQQNSGRQWQNFPGFLPQDSLMEDAKSWYSGRNLEGLQNGYDTPFTAEMFKQRNEWIERAAKEKADNVPIGQRISYYDWLDIRKNPRRTGIASWNNDEADDSPYAVRAGDIFENGKKVGNLYWDLDKHTANVLMVDLNRPRELRGQANEKNDRVDWYNTEAERVIREQSDSYTRVKQNQAYESEIDKQQKAYLADEDFQTKTKWGAAVAGGATAAGTAMVASLPFISFLGPVAPIAAGAIGIGAGILGYKGAEMNQDELADIAARAKVDTDRMNRRFESVGGNEGLDLGDDAKRFDSWSPFVGRLMNPVTNLLHGAADGRMGEVGDGDAEFLSHNPDGSRKASLPMQGVDLLASGADMLLQFSNPVGGALYLANMFAGAVGKAGSLATVGGDIDERTGQIHYYEGPRQWAGAIGESGIELVQLGAVGGLLSKARNIFGKELPGIADEVELMGAKFIKDDAGEVIKQKFTLERLAPSEFVSWMSVKASARVARMKAGEIGKPEPGDLYEAAMRLTMNSKFRSALITGYSEGAEEALQEIAGNVSMGQGIDARGVVTAGLYGAVGGAAMAAGSIPSRINHENRLKARAWTNHMLMTSNMNPTDAEQAEWENTWKGMSWAAKERLAISRPADAKQIQAAMKSWEDMQTLDTQHTSVFSHAQAKMWRNVWAEEQQKNANPRSDGIYSLHGRPGDTITTPSGKQEQAMVSNAAQMSGREVINMLIKTRIGAETIEKSLQNDLDAAKRALLEAQKKGDQGEIDAAKLYEAKTAAKQAQYAGFVDMSERVTAHFARRYDFAMNEGDTEKRVKQLEAMNRDLLAIAQGKMSMVLDEGGRVIQGQKLTDSHQKELARMSVELLLERFPLLGESSYFMAVPQISIDLTATATDGMIYVAQSLLKAPHADHDGDTAKLDAIMALDRETLDYYRRGGQYLEPVIEKVKDAAGNDIEVERANVLMDPPDDEKFYVALMTEAANFGDKATKRAHIQYLGEFTKKISDRYTDTLAQTRDEKRRLKELINEYVENVTNGNTDARQILLSGLVNISPTRWTELSDTGGEPEHLWFLQQMNLMFDQVQIDTAKIRSTSPVQHADVPGTLGLTKAETTARKARAMKESGNIQVDLSLQRSSDEVRNAQQGHYSVIQRAANSISRLISGTGFLTDEHFEYIQAYAVLGENESTSELRRVDNPARIENQVISWLKAFIQANYTGTPSADNPATLTMVANMKVPEVAFGPEGAQTTGKSVTLVQNLLAKAINIELAANRHLEDTDPVITALRGRLTMTRSGTDAHSSDTNAMNAFIDVFGHMNSQQVLGDAAGYLGANLTLAQHIQSLLSVGKEHSSRQIWLWKSSPHYIPPEGRGYGVDIEKGFADDGTPRVNAFTLVVDAISTAMNGDVSAWGRTSKTTSDAVRKGFDIFNQRIDKWMTRNEERLRKEYGHTAGELPRDVVVRDLLKNQTEFADLFLTIIPKDLYRVVMSMVENELRDQAWIVETLSLNDPIKMEKYWELNLKLASFNLHGAKSTEIKIPVPGGGGRTVFGTKKKQEYRVIRGQVDPTKLTSAFEQTIYNLSLYAKYDGGLELARFIRSWDEHDTLQGVYDQINSESIWLGNRQPLIPYVDDLALFQSDPTNVWQQDLPSALHRKALTDFAQRMEMLNNVAIEEAVVTEANRQLARDLKTYVESRQRVAEGKATHIIDNNNASYYYDRIKIALEDAVEFPDGLGRNARRMALQSVMELRKAHDKGAPPEQLQAMGDMLILALNFGVKVDYELELDAQTAYDAETLLTNITMLANQPVRLQEPDGSISLVDLTTPEKIIDALNNPALENLALAIIRPTSRDINAKGQLQHFSDSREAVNLAKILGEASQSDLFQGLTEESTPWAVKVEEAYRYVSRIESYMRRAAAGGTKEQQENAFLPVQQILNEYLVAMFGAPGATVERIEGDIDALVVDIAESLQLLAEVDDLSLDKLRVKLAATLEQRYTSNDQAAKILQNPLEYLLSDVTRRSMVAVQLQYQANEYAKIVNDAAAEIAQLEALTNRTPEQETQLTSAKDAEADGLEQIKVLADAATALSQGKTLDPFILANRKLFNVSERLNYYSLAAGNTPEIRAANLLRKQQWLNFLRERNRVNRFETKKTAPLIRKILRSASLDPLAIDDPKRFSDKEWSEIGAWCATMELCETGPNNASGVQVAPLQRFEAGKADDGKHVRRYYDPSFKYLLDGLFDEATLQAARAISARGKPGIAYAKDAEDKILKELFKPGRIDGWSDRVPVLSLQLRQAMRGSTPHLDIPRGGILSPTRQQAISATQVEWGPRPDSAFMTLATIVGNGPLGIRSGNWSDGDDPLAKDKPLDEVPHLETKLENHFVSRVILQGEAKGAKRQSDLASGIDVTEMVSTTYRAKNMPRKKPGEPELRVLQLSKLEEAINNLTFSSGGFTGKWSVSIEYVDADKRPEGQENSGWFDGVGREAMTGGSGSPGLLANFFFNTRGMSEQSQQRPLDQLTKASGGFFPYWVSRFKDVLKLEAAPADKVLSAKTMHMFKRSYAENLTRRDLPALKKLLELRHVVVLWDTSGKKHVYWIGDYIRRQKSGRLPKAKRTILVPLSHNISQRMLGGNIGEAVPYARVDNFELAVSRGAKPPTLTAEYLDSIGLGRIGENNDDLTTSTLARTPRLPQARRNIRETRRAPNRYENRLQEWSAQTAEQLRFRGESNFFKKKSDIQDARAKNFKQLATMVASDNFMPYLSALGVPTPLLGPQNAALSMKIATYLQEHGTPNSMAWVVGAGVENLNEGVLTKDSFASQGTSNRIAPVHGDTVLLDIDAIRAGARTDEEAIADSKYIVREAASRGVTIVLGSTTANRKIRREVSRWMASEPEIGYRSFAGSEHFFIPITPETEYNRVAEASQSTLLEMHTFSRRGITGRVITQFMSTAATEGAFLFDPALDKQQSREVQVILPTTVLGSGSWRRTDYAAYQEPVKATGPEDQQGYVRSVLLPLLQDETTFKQLVAKLGENPKDVRLRRSYRDGAHVDEGLLSTTEALTRLRDTLASGKWVTDNDEIIYSGTIVPLFDPNNRSILLSRVGFKNPDVREIADQRRTALDQKEPLDGVLGANLAFSSPKLNPNQTLRPPFRILRRGAVGDQRGIVLVGDFMHSPYAKWIDEGIGLKEGAIAMKRFRFLKARKERAAQDQNQLYSGFQESQIASSDGVLGKQATAYVVDDFRTAFAVGGVDLRDVVIRALFGKVAPTLSERMEQWDLAATILKNWQQQQPVMSIQDAVRFGDINSYIMKITRELNEAGRNTFSDPSVMGILKNGWTDIVVPDVTISNPTEDTYAAFILQKMLVAMSTGVSLEEIAYTPGVMTVSDDDVQVKMMPHVFTDALSDAKVPGLESYLLNRVNQGMPRDESGNYISWFEPGFVYKTRMLDEKDNKEVTVEGRFQLIMRLHADDDPQIFVASDIASKQDISSHNIGVSFAALGADPAISKDADFNKWLNDPMIMRFGTGDPEATLWNMLTRIHMTDHFYNPWNVLLPLEDDHVKEGDAKVRAYSQLISRKGWNAAQTEQGKAAAGQLLRSLGFRRDIDGLRKHVDYMVRQYFGKPGPFHGQTDFTEDIDATAFLEAVGAMQKNVEANLHPLHGGMVPVEHMGFWRLVFEANLHNGSSGWAPVDVINSKGEKKLAKEWGEWVNTLFGQVNDSNKMFSAKFLVDTDGFRHTYQGAAPGFDTLAISGDDMLSAKLADRDANGQFIQLLSMDPGKQEQLRDPMILDISGKTYRDLVGSHTAIDILSNDGVAFSSFEKQRAYQRDWADKKKLIPEVEQSFRSFAREGAQYQESARNTSAMIRNFTNATHFTRLANPELFASGFFEMPQRKIHQSLTDILTGSQVRGGGGLLAGLGQKFGWNTQYTPQEIELIRAGGVKLGKSNEWKGHTYAEYNKNEGIGAGTGTVGRFLEDAAGWAAKLASGPRFGLKEDLAAMLYIDGAISYYRQHDTSVSVAQLMKALNDDPMFFVKAAPKIGPSADSWGLNRLANVQSRKQTMAGKFVSSLQNSLVQSSNPFLHFAGVGLIIPNSYARFNMNVATTTLSADALDAGLALFFAGRRKPAAWIKISKKLRSEKFDNVGAEYFNVDDVLESYDMARPIARSLVSVAQLTLLGFLANAAGLTGEDDEERKRRQMERFLDIGHYYDPREAASSFTHADAIFFDGVPFLSDWFKNDAQNSAVVPHWIFRQFLSPIMGVARFFDTGDLRDISRGYFDAFGAIPRGLINSWKTADFTGKLLAEEIAANPDTPDPERQAAWRQTIINLVGIYENAFMENAFVNNVRQAFDEYDRDPWKKPAMDDQGNIIFEPGDPRSPQAAKILEQYAKEIAAESEGKTEEEKYAILQKYQQRSALQAAMHGYAENHLGFSLLASLISGQMFDDNNSFKRSNMVAKSQGITLPDMTKDEAEALVIGLYRSAGGQENYTRDEIYAVIKYKYELSDQRYDQKTLEAQTDAVYNSMKGQMGALETLGPDGKAALTPEGGHAVIRSIWKDMLTIPEVRMLGIHMDQELRDTLAKEIVSELIQEGIDFGLPPEKARYRALRFWYGDKSDPARPALSEILYSKEIPTSAATQYTQMNVTYVIGPDGKPWATPFAKKTLAQTVFPFFSKYIPPGEGTKLDSRGNVVDLVTGINTGLAGVQRKPMQELKQPEGLLDDVLKKEFKPSGGSQFFKSGWRTFPRRGFRSFGRRGFGGGGGGGGFGPSFQRMQPIARGSSARLADVQMINPTNVITRRARVDRDRITSARGRLKQWQ